MIVESLGYRTDLALLGLGGTVIEDRGDHLVVRSPHNPRHRWGNFLLLDGVPGPESSAAWLDNFAAAFPGAAHLCLGFDGTAGDLDDLAWFAANGFTAEAQTVMTATEVHEPPRRNTEASYRRLSSPEDWVRSVELSVRCADDEGDASCYRDFVTAKAATNRGLVEAGHGAWFGAFVAGRLACQMGLFATEPGLARFQAVETDPGVPAPGARRVARPPREPVRVRRAGRPDPP